MSYVTRLERERDRKNVLACKTESECHMCFGVHGRVCVRERE